MAKGWHVLPPLQATMRLIKYDFFRKIVIRHDTGLGESYMAGDYEVYAPSTPVISWHMHVLVPDACAVY